MDVIILSNRYKLIEKIGSGGMALVYKALDLTLDRIVAIKVLKEEYLDDEEFVNRFHAEAQSVAKLSNPNIVGVYDVAVDGKYHYIVMEYIEGVTLSNYIASKKVLESDEAMSIAIQICNALAHAHKNNIVHRDIKPHNILLTKEGVAKVADFGIAKVTTNKTLTLSGRTIGSVHYFSPEQARGGFVDNRTDLYSLGCVLYEMTTGQVPYEGETPVVVAVKHLQEKLKSPNTINKNLHEDVNKIILKAMAKSVDERYQSAKEFQDSLEAVVEGKELPKSFDLELYLNKSENDKENKSKETKDFTPIKSEKKDGNEREEFDFTVARNKQKRYTFSKMLAVFSAILLILLLSFYGIKELITTIIPEDKTYDVQDYTNMYYDNVKAKLEKDFNIIVEKKEVYSDKVVEGVIIDQSVDPGITFKERAVNTIKFTVSLGPELIEIKDYTAFDYRIAEQDLKDLGLKPIKKEIHSEVVAKGGIIRTDPEAFLKVEPNTSITVYVSIGPDLAEVTVPNFIGMTKKEYDEALETNNLVEGEIVPSNLSSETAKVVRQYPEAGEVVYEKTPIHVVFEEENIQGDRLLVKYTLNPANINELSGSIKVYIEILPSDTLKYEILYNKNHDKSEFPIEITVPIPIDGKTTLKVIYNNVHTEMFELLYEDYKDDTSLIVVKPDEGGTTQGGN